MKKKDKELLVKDICSRLPYNNVQVNYDNEICDCVGYAHGKLILVKKFSSVSFGVEPECVRPYLRPVSSMAEKEKKELIRCLPLGKYAKYFKVERDGGIETSDMNDLHYMYFGTKTTSRYIDWLNAHHFDYRRLIDKGLALPAPEEMYDFKE